MRRTSHDNPNDWASCTLCRSQRQSQDVLKRASQRKVKWPEPKDYGANPVQDPHVYTTIDDAFSHILQYMSTTSRQCKRYYKSTPRQTESEGLDKHHCSRFHTKAKPVTRQQNPLQCAEDIHMVVHPGTYAVTAGEWGKEQQQTHVVHVDQGQTVDLDFVM